MSFGCSRSTPRSTHRPSRHHLPHRRLRPSDSGRQRRPRAVRRHSHARPPQRPRRPRPTPGTTTTGRASSGSPHPHSSSRPGGRRRHRRQTTSPRQRRDPEGGGSGDRRRGGSPQDFHPGSWPCRRTGTGTRLLSGSLWVRLPPGPLPVTGTWEGSSVVPQAFRETTPRRSPDRTGSLPGSRFRPGKSKASQKTAEDPDARLQTSGSVDASSRLWWSARRPITDTVW